MMAFHSMILLLVGTALTPVGGSSWRRLKSRMRRRLAGVDMVPTGETECYYLFRPFIIYYAKTAGRHGPYRRDRVLC